MVVSQYGPTFTSPPACTTVMPHTSHHLHPLLHLHPQIQEEQSAVVLQYGPTFTPEAYAAMTYTMATVKEALRAAQIIGFVPRVATRELQVLLPAACLLWSVVEDHSTGLTGNGVDGSS